jgi:hypothetical protein
MDTRRLAAAVDAKARRIEREVADLRRLAAQLRDTVEEEDTPTEGHPHDDRRE